MKSIKNRIIAACEVLVAIPLILMLLMCNILSFTNAVESAQQTMSEVTYESASAVSWELKSFANLALAAGYVTDLSSPDLSAEEKSNIVREMATANGFIGGGFIAPDGSCDDGRNYSDYAYVKRSLKGELVITEPIVGGGMITLLVSAPVRANGNPDGEIVGVAMFICDGEFLNDLMRKIHISDNCGAYIIDANGNTIADANTQTVLDGENIEALAEADTTGQAGYQSLAAAHQKMRAGESGFADYTLNGVTKFIGYAPIEGTNGWSLAIYAPKTDFLGSTYNSIFLSIILFVVAGIAVVIFAVKLGRSIGRPIHDCAIRLDQLARGDLATEVTVVNTKDELGILSSSTAELVKDFRAIIENMDYILGSMAEGKLDINNDANREIYAGDFEKIFVSMNEILAKLNKTMKHIQVSASQVSSGSDQVSAGAQQLSQGTTEQASSIQQLSATINMISKQINDNASEAEEASQKTVEAGRYLSDANEKMNALVAAMNEIRKSSDETKHIIKTIEDIAFQTNILALNAAVEAARAGEAGKGFAVVADEVRNLAGKSAEAANNTTALIENTVEAISRGTSLVNTVAEQLTGVSDSASAVAVLNERISESSRLSANSINQITVGVDQISSVVQNNSATAEESAAASEELSGQAEMLKELIGSFHLR